MNETVYRKQVAMVLMMHKSGTSIKTAPPEEREMVCVLYGKVPAGSHIKYAERKQICEEEVAKANLAISFK